MVTYQVFALILPHICHVPGKAKIGELADHIAVNKNVASCKILVKTLASQQKVEKRREISNNEMSKCFYTETVSYAIPQTIVISRLLLSF